MALASGTHHLYKWDERLTAILAVVKIDGIEYRLGGSAAAQSICPPSVVEGFKCEWLSGLSPAECELAALPESIIAMLLQHKVETRHDYSADPLFADLESELQEARVTKIEAFLTRHKLAPTVVYEHDGRITLLLGRCPFKPVGHDNGDSHVTVFQNGVHAFHCYHTKDNRKTWQDVEEILGDRLDPVIKIGADVHRAIAESIAALAADPTVYQCGELVEVVHPTPQPDLAFGDTGVARLRPIPAPLLTSRLSAVARYDATTSGVENGVGRNRTRTLLPL